MEVSNRRPARPYLLPVAPGAPLSARVDPIPGRPSILLRGDMGLMVRVTRLESTPGAFAHLIIPYDARSMGGLDGGRVRVYRYDAGHGTLTPVWESGVNPASRFVWAKIRRSGTYVAVALEADTALSSPTRSLSLAS